MRWRSLARLPTGPPTASGEAVRRTGTMSQPQAHLASNTTRPSHLLDLYRRSIPVSEIVAGEVVHAEIVSIPLTGIRSVGVDGSTIDSSLIRSREHGCAARPFCRSQGPPRPLGREGRSDANVNRRSRRCRWRASRQRLCVVGSVNIRRRWRRRMTRWPCDNVGVVDRPWLKQQHCLRYLHGLRDGARGDCWRQMGRRQHVSSRWACGKWQE